LGREVLRRLLMGGRKGRPYAVFAKQVTNRCPSPCPRGEEEEGEGPSPQRGEEENEPRWIY